MEPEEQTEDQSTESLMSFLPDDPAPEPAQQDDPKPVDDAQGDQPADDAAAAPAKAAEPEEQEIEYEGERYKVPAKLKDAFLRQADYTRKTTEVAQQKKDIEARANDLKALDEIRAENARFKSMLGTAVQDTESQLAEINKELGASDPNADPMKVVQLTHQKAMLEAKLYAAKAEKAKLDQQTEENNRQVFAQEAQQLKAKRPEWKDAAVWKADYEKMTGYLQSMNYTPEELQAVTDHRIFLLVDKARRFDELMSQKTETIKRIEKLPPKVERPGVPSGTDGQTARGAIERLRKSGSDDDAVAAFETLFH